MNQMNGQWRDQPYVPLLGLPQPAHPNETSVLDFGSSITTSSVAVSGRLDLEVEARLEAAPAQHLRHQAQPTTDRDDSR